jgi:DNA-binding NtrC family response regulator
MSEKILLCIDDEPQILKALERNLRKEGYTLLTTTSVTEAIEWVKKLDVQVVISDYRMQEITGIELLKQIKALKPKVVRAILSGYAEEVLIKNALQNGDVQDFLLKPWDAEKLKEHIRQYFKQYAAA